MQYSLAGFASHTAPATQRCCIAVQPARWRPTANPCNPWSQRRMCVCLSAPQDTTFWLAAVSSISLTEAWVKVRTAGKATPAGTAGQP